MTPKTTTWTITHPHCMFIVPQKHSPFLGNAVASVEVNQLIQGGEHLIPDVVMGPSVLEYLKMLDMVTIANERKKKLKEENMK